MRKFVERQINFCLAKYLQILNENKRKKIIKHLGFFGIADEVFSFCFIYLVFL